MASSLEERGDERRMGYTKASLRGWQDLPLSRLYIPESAAVNIQRFDPRENEHASQYMSIVATEITSGGVGCRRSDPRGVMYCKAGV